MKILRSIVAAAAFAVMANSAEFKPKPIPVMQALPLPHHQISFQRDGAELTRFHHDPADKRSYLYPVNGPAGQALTRMGHPHDPFTHSHHNSLWVSHHDVNGISFWGDQGANQIRCVRVEKLEDSDDFASATVLNSWTSTNKVLLWERQRMTVVSLPDKEWLLLLDLRFDTAGEPVTLGKTSFGMAAVRMAKSIGVNDGGGVTRNSEGGVNEKEVFWKPARWMDYSGAISRKTVEGITLFDHPGNPNYPSVFHVRNDGWMGAALTYTNTITIGATNPLQLRYGFYVHRGMPNTNLLNKRWTEFTRMPSTNMARAKP